MRTVDSSLTIPLYDIVVIYEYKHSDAAIIKIPNSAILNCYTIFSHMQDFLISSIFYDLQSCFYNRQNHRFF